MAYVPNSIARARGGMLQRGGMVLAQTNGEDESSDGSVSDGDLVYSPTEPGDDAGAHAGEDENEDADQIMGESETEADVVELPATEEAPIKVARNPADPTPEERARHNCTHLPHRPWCRICCEARAREDPHYTQTKEQRENGLPRVVVDYCTVGTDEEDKEDSQVCLVARDRWSMAMWAWLCSCKGGGDANVVKQLVKFLDYLGYTRMELKGDGEPALVEVMNKVKQLRKQETLVRNPPTHDPKANGAAERAVQEFKCQMRAVKLGLEQRLKAPLDTKLAVLTWMAPPRVRAHQQVLGR